MTSNNYTAANGLMPKQHHILVHIMVIESPLSSMSKEQNSLHLWHTSAKTRRIRLSSFWVTSENWLDLPSFHRFIVELIIMCFCAHVEFLEQTIATLHILVYQVVFLPNIVGFLWTVCLVVGWCQLPYYYWISL